MATRRQYLATVIGSDGNPLALLLGKDGRPARGKFSAAAVAHLAEVEAKGMTFDEPVKAVATPKAPKAPKPVSLVKVARREVKPTIVKAKPEAVDAKAVRVWAKANGVSVGQRGRIHPDVIALFKADGGVVGVKADRVPSKFDAKPVPTALPPVRAESTAYALVAIDRTRPTSRKVVLNTRTCGAGHAITHCECATPTTSAEWGSVPLSFTKPVV